MLRRNLIAFGTGRKASGKSQLLWDRYVSRAPRVIHLDENDEIKYRDANAIVAVGLPALYDVLRAAAGKGAVRWRVALQGLTTDDVRELFFRLAPPAGGVASLSRTFGGIAIETGEVDVIAPASGVAPEVQGAFKRGRHNLLSLFVATQRPHACGRIVTSQADEIFSFSQHEPADLRYLRLQMGSNVAGVIPRLPKYWHVLYQASTGIAWVCDENRKVDRVIMPDAGQPLTMESET